MAEKTQKIQKYKTDAVNRLKGLIENTHDLIFTDYRGLNVQQITDLRKQLRDRQVVYKVVKNRFAEIALSQLGLAYDKAFLIDPTALAFVNKDSGPAAKVLFDFAKDSPLQVKGAMIDGRVLAAAEVETLSKLPGREQLFAMLMGTLNAPLINLLYATKGVIVKLARTLRAVAEERQH